MLKLVQKGINIMVKQGLIKPVTSKTEKKTTTNKTETSTVSKNNNKKITTTKNYQVRKGISKSILNKLNLLQKKSTIKKKTLLGG